MVIFLAISMLIGRFTGPRYPRQRVECPGSCRARQNIQMGPAEPIAAIIHQASRFVQPAPQFILGQFLRKIYTSGRSRLE